MEFFAPGTTAEAEITEKRSRFICVIAPIESEEDARRELSRVKAKHHAARHNVWCSVLPDGAARYSDDGEPQGTAGAPIAEMLTRENVRGLICVVTRYFGGVLLGPGGLARAYTAAAKAALSECGLRRFVTRKQLAVRCSYALAPLMKAELARCGGETETAEYGADVVFTASFREADAAAFTVAARERSAGAVTPEDLGDVLRHVD
jgi:uncharacterized YigZ family protein